MKVLSTLLLFSLTTAFTPAFRGNARLFLDSADMAEWDSLLPTGVFYGVTTNPSLLERCNQPCTVENLNRLARKALTVSHEFFCQAWGTSADEIYDNGFKLSLPDRDRIVIKVPITKMGVEACHRLHQSGVKVCLTACYNKEQALVAAGVGANYVAPHLDRMNAAGREGFEECKQMIKIMDGLGSDTRVLLASIRNTECMSLLAAEGFDSFAMPGDVAEQLFVEPLTDARAEEFQGAAERGSKKQKKTKGKRLVEELLHEEDNQHVKNQTSVYA